MFLVIIEKLRIKLLVIYSIPKKLTLLNMGKGTKMITSYYARSTQGKKMFLVSIMGIKNKNECNFRNFVTFDRR